MNPQHYDSGGFISIELYLFKDYLLIKHKKLLLLYKILFGVFYKDGTAEGSCSRLYCCISGLETLFVFVNKIQVECKKKKIESEEVRNLPDTFLHKSGFNRFSIGYSGFRYQDILRLMKRQLRDTLSL